MEDWQLPSELQQLERDLGNRLRAGAFGLLATEDTRRFANPAARRTRARWQFALALAVVVLVWMNLSISATQATDFGLRPAMPSESIETMADRIRQLAPEFSLTEARRQAILLRAGSTVVCYPNIGKRAAADDSVPRHKRQPKE